MRANAVQGTLHVWPRCKPPCFLLPPPAGIVNVMQHVKRLDGAAPHAVIGGGCALAQAGSWQLSGGTGGTCIALHCKAGQFPPASCCVLSRRPAPLHLGLRGPNRGYSQRYCSDAARPGGDFFEAPTLAPGGRRGPQRVAARTCTLHPLLSRRECAPPGRRLWRGTAPAGARRRT